MTKTMYLVLGKFLAGQEDIPELYKMRIPKKTSPGIWMVFNMLKGAPNIQDKTTREMILKIFEKEIK